MILIAIILATLAAGIGSVWLAALLMRLGLGGRADGVGPQHLLSLAAGALLATAFMHLLPEAFESQAGAHDLFATLLVGVVFFFLLDKAELWHHGHEHSHSAPAALGGVVGYFLVGQLQDFLPYFLAVASSSFVYVALADLIPQLQKRLTARETIAQIAWLIAGMVIVTLVSGAAHAH
jgi:zinc transporter ZupT